MSRPDQRQVHAGQAVYTPLTLMVYDWAVLGFSNQFLWRCPTARLRALYDRNVSDNHLDIGVGTGYFLDKANWPSAEPHITLVDLNPNSLDAAAKRIARYRPEKVVANVFEPLPLDRQFKSIGLSYLFHCLPGDLSQKVPAVLENAGRFLAEDGVLFGATILQGDAPRSRPAQALMNLYNAKGVFSNANDALGDLRHALDEHFTSVEIVQHGVVALFACRAARSMRASAGAG